MEELTSYEILEWRAYDALEPFGDVRADRRLGELMALYYNAHKGKRDKIRLWHDFLPNAEMPQPKVSTPEEVAKVFKTFNERFQEPPAQPYKPNWKGRK